jgi:hypothetical protein
LGRYAEDNEIIQVMNSSTPEQAAKTLVDLAVGRNVDDNVTAVVVEMPGRKRKLISRLPQVGTTAAIILSVTLCALVIFGFFGVQNILDRLEPTPMPGFAYVSDVSGGAENQVPGDEYRPIRKGDSVPFGHGSLVRINDGVAQFNSPGNFKIYAIGKTNRPTIIEFFKDGDPTLEQDETIIRLLDGTIIVDKNDVFESNIVFKVETVSGQAIISGTVMGNRYNSGNQVFDVACFTGRCQLISLGVDASMMLLGGEHSWVDASGQINNPDGINYDNYAGLLDRVFDPTETPTLIPTGVTITATASPLPSNTPAPTKELTPTPIPKRFTLTPSPTKSP